MIESRKLRAQCSQANATDIRDTLTTSETTMAALLDQWNEMAVKTQDPNEPYHLELKDANVEAQKQLKSLTELLSKAEKDLGEFVKQQKAKNEAKNAKSDSD